jgi:hypothetical protein
MILVFNAMVVSLASLRFTLLLFLLRWVERFAAEIISGKVEWPSV